MRIRREAKILKNYYREITWTTITTDDDEFEFPVSRYKPGRLCIAHCRLVRGLRRRYANEAKREYKRHGRSTHFKYLNHTTNSMFIEDDAYAWWNIQRD